MDSSIQDTVHFISERVIDISSVTETQTASANATRALINQLIFAESKSVRTSTIILAAFNVTAAILTVVAILYDCYIASRRASVNNKPRKFCVSNIHPAETFPLVLSLGIAIQGIVFAATQAAGLQSIYIDGCEVIGQLVFPAVFLVPYIQLVFGLECAIRSFRTLPFQARGRFDVSICIAVVLLMVTGTWIPSHINPEEDLCFASLMWFVTRFGVEGLVLLAAMAGLSTVAAIVIFYRLSTGSLIDQHQRIAASRMVYYLVLAVVPLAFVIPWFITLTLDAPNLTASMMATVVMNLSGILNGALYIFLRSNTVATSFCPKDFTPWTKHQHEIRLWGPNELGFTDHLLIPVTGPRSDSQIDYNLEKVMSDESLISMFSPDPRDVIIIESPTPLAGTTVLAVAPVGSSTPVTRSPSKRLHTKNTSYSLFPAEGLASPNVPAIVTNTPTQTSRNHIETRLDTLDITVPSSTLPRASIPRHSRNLSAESTTTVQIGMRFSGAIPLDLGNAASAPYEVPALLSATYQTKPNPTRTVERKVDTLQVRTQNLSPHLPPRSPYRPSPLGSTTSPYLPATSPQGTRNKQLPAAPRSQQRIASLTGSDAGSLTLSPTVYNLTPTVYTPVGRPGMSRSNSQNSNLQRSASNASRSQRERGVVRSPSSGSSDGLTRTSRGEWI